VSSRLSENKFYSRTITHSTGRGHSSNCSHASSLLKLIPLPLHSPLSLHLPLLQIFILFSFKQCSDLYLNGSVHQNISKTLSSTVAQWLALLPHSARDLGSILALGHCVEFAHSPHVCMSFLWALVQRCSG